MNVYASETTVDSSRSRAEIERTLSRYGATAFSYGWEAGRAAIAFVADGRQIRFVLPLPDKNLREFTHTPSTKRPRTPQQVEAEYEKAVRQRWRALALVVKAKLEAVNAGIVTFEQEFYAHTVLPNGRTVYEHTHEVVENAYLTGSVAPLLAITAEVGRG
ncbi:hypothetical protein [Pseudarthrobacter sp. NIBRBAC000502770]|uniref:hypothetical protein n=1 Tax=Pseudarthrobacter sp. NIBRBAC000502770 TaxID=2590785 RepID=UPI0011408BEB|nr:hypothetical protein [Pseudarthrobacter sp. NIBRBAC000502770]QDG90680.1 hypothetical protein NIBR502770_20880 [Pseudarthrobacter sp. NIBRBAC000502770]